MSAPEKWGLALFLIALVLAFSRQFFADYLTGLTPAFAFLVFGIACFVIRHRRAPLLDWEFA